MKVAQILYSGLGGHGSVVFSLIGGDTQKKWANVLGFLGIEPQLPEYRARCEEAALPYRYFPARAGRPWTQWWAIFRWFAAERPDAIINHSAAALVPCAFYAAAAGIPLVYVEHTPIDTKSSREWMASRLAMIIADGVVMLTAEYERLSRERLGLWMQVSKVSIIPNGINTNRFVPSATKCDATGKRRIGMAARFSSAKRQDLLIEVVRALYRTNPNAGWQLTLAGDGEELKRLEALAQETAPGLVEFAGLLDEDKLVRWFHSLDIYAHASNGETLSTSLLQAKACELPIVASDVKGIRELLEPDQAILAPNDDVTAWTIAILDICSDPREAGRRAKRAREATVENFGAAAMHRRYDELFTR